MSRKLTHYHRLLVLTVGGLFMTLAPLVLKATAEPSREDLFTQGNEAYAQGNFAQARDLYERIAGQRHASAELSFNLGNAYYRLGQLGKARLWYERAAAQRPGDEDVRHNRSLVRAQAQEPDEDDGFRRLAGWLPFLLWALFAVNAVFFALLGVGLFRSDEWGWWGRWVSGILLALMLALALVARSQREPRGVVVEHRVEVRTGPGPDYRVGFIVPEGQSVVLFESDNDWRQVGVPEKGLKGWVPSAAVEPVAFE